MHSFNKLLRLIRINFILVSHGLDKMVLSLHLFAPLRFLAYLNPWNWNIGEEKPRGERLRLALIALGPIFVKFGQALSTRQDLLPDDIASELALLQDKVPPFSSEKAKAIIQEEFGKPAELLFQYFESTPLASASIAQVHAARLHDGKEVVVKILRPDIRKTIRSDISILYTIADLAEKYWSGGKRLRPKEVVAEFEKTIFAELELLREAANASQLKRNFAGSTMLYIPEIYWPYAREKVLVMERISGIPVSDIDSLLAHNIDLKKLAERGVEIFFTQVFRDSFFHADMHPGNIFVSPKHPTNPQYLAVDFGIMGTLDDDDQRYLAENMLAFFKRDYHRVAVLHVQSGWIPRQTRVADFESAIRTVCEPIFEKPLKDISAGYMLLQLFQTSRRFNMEVQPQLILLQKTLLQVEGLGRQLYPELDLWNTAKPFLEKWVAEKLGVKTAASKIVDNIPHWLEKLPRLPDLIFDTLQAVRAQSQYQQLVQEKHAIKRTHMKSSSFFFGIGLALLTASGLMWWLNNPLPILIGVGLVSLLIASFSYE